MTDSAARPPCNHEPWNPTLIIHADGRTEVTCNVCGEVVPYKEPAARPPREMLPPMCPVCSNGPENCTCTLEASSSPHVWEIIAKGDHLDNKKFVELDAYQALLAERQKLLKEIFDLEDKAIKDLADRVAANMDYSNLLAQAEALAGALNIATFLDHKVHWVAPMNRDELRELVSRGKEALSAWSRFKGEGGTRE